MLKSIKMILLTGILFCFLLNIGLTQPIIKLKMNPALANQVQQPKLNVLYFSNFDLLNQGTAKYIFDVTIDNITQSWENTKIILEVELDGQIVASAESDPFLLTEPPGSSDEWKASNDVLINAQTFPGSGMLIEFNTTSIDPPFRDTKFEDELFNSGKARKGRYILRGKLINNTYNWPLIPERTPELVFLISNPSNIQLSGPGNRVGQGMPMEIMTEFPVFAFFYDGSEYIFNLYEKLSFHTSVEDVINSKNPIYQSEPLIAPILNYADAIGGQPLQVGSTYYWYVDVLVYTTAGVEKFRSEVYQFKVTQGTGTNAEGIAFASIIEMLRPIVGNQVDDLSKNLSDFELKTIRLNGKPITMYELHQIIDGYEGHLVEVLELVLY